MSNFTYSPSDYDGPSDTQSMGLKDLINEFTEVYGYKPIRIIVGQNGTHGKFFNGSEVFVDVKTLTPTEVLLGPVYSIYQICEGIPSLIESVKANKSVCFALCDDYSGGIADNTGEVLLEWKNIEELSELIDGIGKWDSEN